MLGSVIQIMILMIAAIIFIMTVWDLSKFKYLKNGNVELAYGIRGIVEKYMEEFEHTRLIGIIVGIVCLIGSVILMMIVSVFTSYNDAAIVVSGCLMLLIFSGEISSIVYVQTIHHGYKRILKMIL